MKAEKYTAFVKRGNEVLPLIIKGESKGDVENKLKKGKYVFDSIEQILSKQEFLDMKNSNKKSQNLKGILKSNSDIYCRQLNLGRSRSFGSKKLFIC